MFTKDKQIKIAKNYEQGAEWSGESDILARLINPCAKKNEDDTYSDFPQNKILWQYFTLQDAVDFAKYAIETTAKTMQKKSCIVKSFCDIRKEFMRKAIKYILLLILTTMLISGCGDDIKEGSVAQDGVTSENDNTTGSTHLAESDEWKGVDNAHDIEPTQDFIDATGATLETRIIVPEGYERTLADEGSLTAFLRGYELKEDDTPVLLYNGNEKDNQSVHAAVFALPIENADLQQCADSVMRVYAEYYWHSGQYDKIAFHFTNGFLCEYSKWREGYRVVVSGNDVYWEKSADYDDSYDTFVKYLRMVFSYAGTLSMDTLESETITLSELEVGDVILKGGSPGHVIMVVDVCEKEDGKKAFLFAQGYMPAQEFHVINNPAHIYDPWYYEDEIRFPLRTAEYTFGDESMIQRLYY